MTSPGDDVTSRDGRVAEVAARIDWLRAAAASKGAAGVLIRSRATFAWLTLGGLNHVVVGTELGAVPALVGIDGAWALAPINEADRIAEEELVGLPLDVQSVPWDDPGAIDAEARRLIGGEFLSEQELATEISSARSVLGPLEHERMRGLAADVAAVMGEATAGVRSGAREHAVAGVVAGGLLERGARAPVLLAAADERIERFRHPIPTDRAIRRRVMVVVVAERHGLHVASTRFAELEPSSDEIRRRAEATSEVLAAMRDATGVGSTLDDVLAAARGAYGRTGFGEEWRLHHQGGTIGYAPRERIAMPGDTTRLEAGMAVAWNPSITGTKLESTMLVTRDAVEQLPG